MRKMTKNQDFSAKFSQNQPNLEFIKGQDFKMYDQLALESVSNTNLGQNLKRAMNKDRIYQPDLEFVIKISMYFNF